MSIKALDKKCTTLLITTQVVTSVCTATKELIENALDAGSSNIEISLAEHGTSQIEVKDNGCGIPKVDVPCMALPSFTSKLTNFQDLDILDTYGFRGEALCSLCAIADVTITTKTVDDDTAMSYTLNSNGSIVKSELSHGTVGTTVQVNNIFKSMPVRRHIVTNNEKAKQDVKLLESYIRGFSMCKPHVRFLFRVNGRTVFMKPSTNSVKESVSFVLGKKIVSNMEWIESEDVELTIKLLVPSKSVKDLSDLYQTGQELVFINDRSVTDRRIEQLIEKILTEYFEQKMRAKKRLIFLLYMLIDSKEVDVNVNPNKTAVFLHDKERILKTLEILLNNYYGIPNAEPVQENLSCDVSEPYNDYTDRIDTDAESPVTKKRKRGHNEKVSEFNQVLNDRVFIPGPVNVPCISSDNTRANSDERKKTGNKLSISNLEGPNLSEDDSNETIIYDSSSTVQISSGNDSVKIVESSSNENISQLPVVDLGDDFDLSKFSDSTKVEEGNSEAQMEQKKVRSYTLKEWSKGHVLQGGTDVIPYRNSDGDDLCSQYNYSIDESICEKSTCKGFLEYSKEFRKKLLKNTPNMTAVEVARKLISMWKELSSEERGLYRDQADDEKANRKVAKPKCKVVSNEKVGLEKSKKILLQMLERAKITENSKTILRTIVPWGVDLTQIIEKFKDKPTNTHCTTVVGLLTSNLWILQNTSQLWLLDVSRVKNELTAIDKNLDQLPNAEGVKQSLRQWLVGHDDLSMMHPIHSFSKSGDKPTFDEET